MTVVHVHAEAEKPPLSADGRTAAEGRHSTTQGVSPATLNPRIHCEGTPSRNG